MGLIVSLYAIFQNLWLIPAGGITLTVITWTLNSVEMPGLEKVSLPHKIISALLSFFFWPQMLLLLTFFYVNNDKISNLND